MTAAQARLADTIDVFYGAADKASEGAMAAHAYKRSVEELDTGIGREMVCPPDHDVSMILNTTIVGCSVSTNDHGTPRQDERVFPRCQRAHQQA